MPLVETRRYMFVLLTLNNQIYTGQETGGPKRVFKPITLGELV